MAVIRATNISRGRILSDAMMRVALQDLPLDRAPLLAEGEILVVRSGAYTGDSAMVTAEWAGSAPGYDLRLTPEKIHPRYLSYALLSEPVAQQVQLACSRAAQPHLNAEDLGEIAIDYPSLDEQRRIADVLDAETARIERLAEARRRQLRLFEERSLTRAFYAVGGDEEPDDRVDSGLSWLGSVPGSWLVASVASQFEVQLGKMLNPDRILGDHLKPYLRNVNVQWDRITTDSLLYMDFPPHERRRYGISRGDLLVCEGGEPGRAAIWDGALDEVYYQKALHRVRSRGRSSVRWLYHCLRVAAVLNVFAAEGNTTTISHLTAEQLKAHRFPFPEREIQERIVRRLDRQDGSDGEIVKLLNAQLALLEERRKSFVTAAVTGQLDPTTARGADV